MAERAGVGRKLSNVDALSRNPCAVCRRKQESDEISDDDFELSNCQKASSPLSQIFGTPSDFVQISPNGNSQKKRLDVDSFPVQENDLDFVKVVTQAQKAHMETVSKPT
ncbi:hypothetical protein CHS0354_014325 [Potamilus streckersoni]|uniref:Uncharacterized protein n=1 Tax=Potamilus streckersoni TaxID=2493646 RepID=A0AAE0SLT7_9BIVA|nr:hypothetical protein CHS0354_014325 [Potamilus streckersoni]